MLTARSPSVSVIVPVYDAATTLTELVDRIEASLSGRTFEVVLVNDASDDASWDEIEALAGRDRRVRGFDLAHNVGQHRALLLGARVARHEVLVTIDDDLQSPPEEIPRLLEELEAGFDVVYGTPEPLGRASWPSRSTSWIARETLRRAAGVEVARRSSSFRAFRAALRPALAVATGRLVCLDALLAGGGARFGAVPVRHEPRRRGASGYGLRKRAELFAGLLSSSPGRGWRAAGSLGERVLGARTAYAASTIRRTAGS